MSWQSNPAEVCELVRILLEPTNEASLYEDIEAFRMLKPGKESLLFMRNIAQSLQMQMERDMFDDSNARSQALITGDADPELTDVVLIALQEVILKQVPVPLIEAPISSSILPGAIWSLMQLPMAFFPIISGYKGQTIEKISEKSGTAIQRFSASHVDPVILRVEGKSIEAVNRAREMILQCARRFSCQSVSPCRHLFLCSLNIRLAKDVSVVTASPLHVFIDLSNILIAAKKGLINAATEYLPSQCIAEYNISNVDLEELFQ